MLNLENLNNEIHERLLFDERYYELSHIIYGVEVSKLDDSTILITVSVSEEKDGEKVLVEVPSASSISDAIQAMVNEVWRFSRGE